MMLLKSIAIICTLIINGIMASPAPLTTANHNIFAAQLFSTLVEQKASENIVYSPVSIQTALGLAFVGAEGETAEEMRNVLRLGEGDKTSVSENFGDFVKTLSKSTKNVEVPQLKIATRIYIAEDLKIAEKFNRIAQEQFEAEAQNINFTKSEEAANEINKWVEQQTENKIHDLIEPNNLQDHTAMVLVNAIYFKAQWSKVFLKELTTKETFHVNRKQQQQVPIMFNAAEYRYAELPTLEAKALELPYNNSAITMLIILPNDIEGLEKLESRLRNVDLNAISSELNTENVEVYLPKFHVEYKIDLKESLQKMGMSTIFTSAADFSGILQSSSKLSVSKVIHKAFLDVDEFGSEAAAATYDSFVKESVSLNQKIFRADHPFIFAIRSKSAVYFAGHVVTF